MTPNTSVLLNEVKVLLPTPLLHNRCCVFLYGLNTTCTYPLRTEKERNSYNEELERDHVYKK